MRIQLLIVPLFFVPLFSTAQDTIEVVDKSIKIGAMSPLIEYYGFANGDKVIFNFWVEKGKDLKDLTISEYPNNPRYAQHSVEKIENKVIEIPRNGIYKFEYNNSTIIPRIVNIRIQRIPGNAASRSFNTNVKWIEISDKAHPTEDVTYQIKSDTTYQDVFNSTIKVNSKTGAANTHRTLIDFTLPALTARWAYWIGVGQKGMECFEKDQIKFSEHGKAAGINALAPVLLGLSGMTQVKAGENIRYFFISRPEETTKFLEGSSFGQFKRGDMVVDFGLMNYANRDPQKYFLGLSNDNTTQSAQVQVRIVAMVIGKRYESQTKNVETYSTNRIPVHEQ